VILAACETGRGRITGDGVLGFNRAFTFAGAPSLLMSLWRIPVERTAAQLRHFHDFLDQVPAASGAPAAGDLARALQHAEIRALQETPLQPNLWAGLILFGEP
jgi:CHAT domain-containing protein